MARIGGVGSPNSGDNAHIVEKTAKSPQAQSVDNANKKYRVIQDSAKGTKGLGDWKAEIDNQRGDRTIPF